MKAVLCKQFGSPETLTVEDIPSPPLRGGEVRVKVRAAGVNFPDLLMIQGLYQLKPDFPFSPGLEIAGDVMEVGAGVGHIKAGDRVIGILNYGGFAEEAVIPAAMTIPMPENMPYEHGAAFPIVYGTSHLALWHRAKLQAGETLLVLGAAGGVGLTAVEIGHLMGANVIAAASTAEKLALTEEYGANHTLNYVEHDLREQVKALTGGDYAHVIYDPVGGSTFDAAVRCLAWEGRYLVIGFASGEIPQVQVNRMLLKNSALVGVFWGAYALHDPKIMQQSLQTLLGWYTEGKIKPHIDQTFPLEQAADALQRIANRDSKGKMVLIPS